ncbi:NUDIX domain-containing protein [Myceligenerans xiligouense]|uniref:NUDIX domain-containing protein n=1 Tax=Myceligenerans xiligouense TaxID=253184 RepID=UPI000F5022E2
MVLIKRTKPGYDPYWTSPGGGVEESDATVEDALRRELAEELGATAGGYQQVLAQGVRAREPRSAARGGGVHGLTK